jgi:uncharacterized SAM-binding protein YcdF (DUF218 family)
MSEFISSFLGGEFKPVVGALLLPPAGPLLLVLLGLCCLAIKKRASCAVLVGAGGLLLGLFSCHGVAVWLAQHALPQFAPVQAAQLKAQQVQAVVVLGGGVQSEAPEYGSPQLNSASSARLRYGAWLAREAKLPLGFAGGVGWASAQTDAPPEGLVAQRVALREHQIALRFVDMTSRDTQENARAMRELLATTDIRKIALVTHAWHMPRAQRAFAKVFVAQATSGGPVNEAAASPAASSVASSTTSSTAWQVIPAPMGFVLPTERALLEWLPSGHGLQASRQVLREWLALQLQ